MENTVFKFSNLSCFPEVVHGISTREYANMKFTDASKVEQVIENRQEFAKALGIDPQSVTVAKLSHGKNIVKIDQNQKGKGFLKPLDGIEDADGLITNQKGLFLALTVADCLPIMAYDPVTRMVGIVHAGWRGVLHGIATQLVNAFKENGSYAQDIIIGIGPSICQRHFVVKNEVRELFSGKFPKSVLVRNHDGYVDLKQCAVEELLKNGIAKANLEVAKECTKCNNYYFSSFRYEKEKTVYQIAIIGLK